MECRALLTRSTLVLSLLLSLPSVWADRPPHLKYVELPRDFYSSGITNSGYIGGNTYDASNVPHATVYQFTQGSVKLIYEDVDESFLFRLNEDAVGVGVKLTQGIVLGHLFLAKLGQSIPITPDFLRNHADVSLVPWAINRSWQVVGTFMGNGFTDDSFGPVFRTQTTALEFYGTTKQLPDRDTPLGTVTDLNDLGTTSVNTNDGKQWNAELWQADGTSVALGPGYIWRMQRSGSMAVGDINLQAAVWSNNQAHVIGGPFSIAFGVNSRGFVVGYDAGSGFGYIQESGQEQFYWLDDLTDGLPPGGKIASGHHINDDGVIFASVDIPTSDPMNPEHRSGLLVLVSSN